MQEEPKEKAIEKAVASHVQRAGVLEIKTAQQYETAVDFIKDLRTLKKRIDEDFDPIIRLQREALDEARKRKAKHWEPVDAADKLLSRRVADYSAEQARLKRERDEAEKAAAKKLEEGKTKEAKQIVKAAPLPPPPAPKVEGLAQTVNWKFRVVDPAAIPREYLMVDEKKIGQIVRAMKDQTNILGIEPYPEPGIRVRL